MKLQIVFSLSLAAVALCSCQGGKRKPKWGVPRIIGGKDAVANEYPYQVSLEVDGSHNCGGAILTEYYIVTAAHCVKDFAVSTLSIRAGSILRETEGQKSAISRIILHPEYDSSIPVNDIALLQLTTPLKFDESVQTIRIATSPPPTGAEVTVVGWGLTAKGLRADRLQYTKMNVTPTKACQLPNNSKPIENILCLLDKGISSVCNTDSGGAAIYQGTLVGVASYGKSMECTTWDPVAYTMVPNYLKWLTENTDL